MPKSSTSRAIRNQQPTNHPSATVPVQCGCVCCAVPSASFLALRTATQRTGQRGPGSFFGAFRSFVGGSPSAGRVNANAKPARARHALIPQTDDIQAFLSLSEDFPHTACRVGLKRSHSEIVGRRINLDGPLA